MARSLIGLDVGTSAVRAVALGPSATPELESFGQVALPPDAMRDGEVQDPAAVSAAISRLWRELDLPRRAAVRIGLATPRVIVRPVDLAAMPEAELAGALRYQAQELIPIPIEDAYLDFLVQETFTNDDGNTINRLLLAAAHRSTVDRLRAAVQASGLSVQGIDLVPLGLIRAARLSHPEGTEAQVSVGAGVTVVAVHEGGIPRFVRMLGSGGRFLTEAIAAELDVPTETAEALKRRVPEAPGELVARAVAALEGPVGNLVEEIRGSIDYYLNQPNAAALDRIVVTGGGALLDGFAARLESAVNVPVVASELRSHLSVGDIGFPPEDLPRIDPYLPVPTGLALGGQPGLGRQIDLLGGAAKLGGAEAEDRRTLFTTIAVVAAVLVVLLGFLSWNAMGDQDDANAAQAKAEATNAALQQQIADLSDVAAARESIVRSKAAVEAELAGDVAWSDLLVNVSKAMPEDTWLVNFTGTATRPGTQGTTGTPGTTGSTASGATRTPSGSSATSGTAPITGPVTFSAMGLDFQSVSDWITGVQQLPSLTGLWVSNASKPAPSDAAPSDTSVDTTNTLANSSVTFASNATLTPEAQSTRLAEFQEQTK